MANIEQTNFNDRLTIEPTLGKTDIIAMLYELCPGGENAGEWLRYRKHDLRVSVEIAELRSDREQSAWSAMLLFIAKHPFFDEDLVQQGTAVGRDADDAIRSAAKQIAAEPLAHILAAFDTQGGEVLETNLRGELHRFHAPVSPAVSHIGAGEPPDLWHCVKDVIPQYLGTKRCYWVSLSAATANGIPQCEARINGSVLSDLSYMLMDALADRTKEPGFIADRAFVLLIQDEETYQPCPFTKQEVGELVFRALRLLPGVKDKESDLKIQKAILGSAPQRSLGVELISFLPEIVAIQTVHFRDNDGLMPVVNRGKPDVELKKSQVRSFGYMEDAVFQYLQKQRPDEVEIKHILAMSAKFHALTDGLEQGTPIGELRMSQLVYFVDETYRVW